MARTFLSWLVAALNRNSCKCCRSLFNNLCCSSAGLFFNSANFIIKRMRLYHWIYLKIFGYEFSFYRQLVAGQKPGVASGGLVHTGYFEHHRARPDNGHVMV